MLAEVAFNQLRTHFYRCARSLHPGAQASHRGHWDSHGTKTPLATNRATNAYAAQCSAQRAQSGGRSTSASFCGRALFGSCNRPKYRSRLADQRFFGEGQQGGGAKAGKKGGAGKGGARKGGARKGAFRLWSAKRLLENWPAVHFALVFLGEHGGCLFNSRKRCRCRPPALCRPLRPLPAPPFAWMPAGRRNCVPPPPRAANAKTRASLHFVARTACRSPVPFHTPSTL